MTEVKLPYTHILLTHRISQNDQEVLYEILETEAPMSQEQQDAYAQIIGDGKAKVTVSRSISEKNFGTGREAFVAVTITVHQSEEHIRYGAVLCKNVCDSTLEADWLELKKRPMP
jgi:hypothetical protein